jgi:hypothetical protein
MIKKLLTTTLLCTALSSALFVQQDPLYAQYLLNLRGVSGAPVSVDLAFNVNLNAIHIAGIFTRNFNTYGLLVQTLIKEQLRFGYVFELPTNKSVGINFYTHEISVGVLLSAFSFHERTLGNF